MVEDCVTYFVSVSSCADGWWWWCEVFGVVAERDKGVVRMILWYRYSWTYWENRVNWINKKSDACWWAGIAFLFCGCFEYSIFLDILYRYSSISRYSSIFRYSRYSRYFSICRWSRYLSVFSMFLIWWGCFGGLEAIADSEG